MDEIVHVFAVPVLYLNGAANSWMEQQIADLICIIEQIIMD